MAGLNNCSVTTNGTASLTGGASVGTRVIQMIISPSNGYVVAADKFVAGNGSPTVANTFERGVNGVSFDQTGTDNDEAIQKVVFSNSTVGGTVGNTVLVDITLEEDYVMPAGNTGLTIDIDGDAAIYNLGLTLNVVEPYQIANQTITNTLVGTENTTNFGVTAGGVQANTPSAGLQTTQYTLSDTFDTNKIVLKKKYAAAATYYYKDDPYYNGTSINSDFTITNTVTRDSDDQTTAKEFEIKYKIPTTAHTATIEFFPVVFKQPGSLAKEITSYDITDDNIDIAGETRTLKIYGVSGAKFDLTISDGSKTYDFSTDTFTASATLLDDAEIGTQYPTAGTGYYEVDIVFPANAGASAVTYTFTIAAGTATSLGSGLGTNPFTIAQKGNSTVTFSMIESNATWTPTSLGTSVTKTAAAGSEGGPTFDMSFAITDDATFYLRRQPLGSDFTNQTANSMLLFPGVITTNKSTNHGAGSAGMTSLTITATGTNIMTYPTASTTCSIDLGALVNTPPVAASAGYSIDEDEGTLNINLASSATDANSDTLTYAIVADNTGSNGALTLTSAANGTVTYVPVQHNNTNVTFTWKCNDGYQDSNTATGSITVVPVADAPTDITLSANTQAENTAINTTIGAFSTTDVDVGDTHTYTLVSGTGSTDNASFNISGANLRNSIVFDYETKTSYSIRVRSTDSFGETYEEAFTINVTDVSEQVSAYEIGDSTGNLACSGAAGIQYMHPTKYCDGSGNLVTDSNLDAWLNTQRLAGKWIKYTTVAQGCNSSPGAIATWGRKMSGTRTTVYEVGQGGGSQEITAYLHKKCVYDNCDVGEGTEACV